MRPGLTAAAARPSTPTVACSSARQAWADLRAARAAGPLNRLFMPRNVTERRVADGFSVRCRSVEPLAAGKDPVVTDPNHRRPAGLDDTTVQALGKLSEALETTERARGHLYEMHQLTGTADFQLDEAVALFRRAGHAAVADRIERELIGRNVIPGHWTFQVIEEYDDGYYREFRTVERQTRDELADGRR